MLVPCLALASSLVGVAVSRAEDPPKDLDSVVIETKLDPTTPIEAEKLLRLWAERLKAVDPTLTLIVDQQVAGTKIRFLQTEVTLTWAVVKQILAFHQVVIEERLVNGHLLLIAHLQRNVMPQTGVRTEVVREDSIPQREEIVTALIQVTKGSAPDIFANLRGLFIHDQTHLGNIQYVRGPEMLIIVDFASNVEYYLKVIRALDVSPPGQALRIFEIRSASVDDVAKVVQTLFRGGQPGAPGVPTPGMMPGGAQILPPQITTDPRTNQLFIQAYREQFDEIQRVIDRLDIPAPLKPSKWHRYKCKHLDSHYLADKLQQLVLGLAGSTPSAAPKRPTGPTGPGAPTAPPALPPAPAPIPQGGPQAKADFNGVDTRIVSDEQSNSLLIQADERIYPDMERFLAGLDVAPRRVLVEVQIWQVTTNDGMTLGVELADVNNPSQGSYRPSAATGFGLSSIAVDPTTQTLSRIPNFGNGITAVLTKDTFGKLPVIIQAVANLENSKLVTTPFALTNDNKSATFTIDHEIPYPVANAIQGVGVQGSFATTHVTTTLTVTPQVNSDDNVTLDVSVSLGSSDPGSGNGPPPTTSDSYSGVVTVPNLQYCAFGGLEQEHWDQNETKVPFVGDVPILGHLFKRKQWTHDRSKIYIFMRPVIFADDQAGSGDTKIDGYTKDLLQRAHLEAGRDEWLPPICEDRFVTSPFFHLQDEVFKVFGTGSGNPFAHSPEED
jgi:general secretion pathway protein D